ncbi:MAG TPA: ferritin [Ruminiclostridium sp.]|mgnify:CR=1|jgi:ferritin|nr:ferritin [Ruminiclostridium sp.]
MLKKNVETLLNQQITKELYSAQLYLSMSAWFSSKDLDGFAKWYYVQSLEERAHAMIIYHYIIKAGGTVKLEEIEAPGNDWSGVLGILEETVKHEEYVTSLIYDIIETASREKDLKVVQFFQWFVDEQVEEEDNANKNKGRFETMGMDGKALYLLDQELGARVYTAPPLLTTLEGSAP